MEETKHVLDLSDRMYRLPVTLISVLAIFLVGFLIYEFKSLPQNAPSEISVSGEGKAYAKPDIAMVSLGVEMQGFKSQDVVNQSNEKMGKIINSLKDLGVHDKDIQTTLYSLNPIYDYTENGRVFRGYSINQQVSVKIRDFDKINEILDKSVANGANKVGDIRFTVDDMEKFRSEARAKAIEAAKTKALVMAKQSGLRIKKLVNVYEGGSVSPQPFYDSGFGGAMLEKSVAPQIESGQLEINTSVTLIYRVR